MLETRRKPMPPLLLGREAKDRLYALAMEHLLRSPRTAGALLEELRRAIEICDGDLGPDTITLGSKVVVLDDRTGKTEELTLVLPHEAEPSEASVSVLSSVGSALIGLSKGQSISWPDRVGGRLNLTVLDVQRPVRGSAALECDNDEPRPADEKVLPFRRPAAPAEPPDDAPPPAAA